jgi:hypothetical protein
VVWLMYETASVTKRRGIRRRMVASLRAEYHEAERNRAICPIALTMSFPLATGNKNEDCRRCLQQPGWSVRYRREKLASSSRAWMVLLAGIFNPRKSANQTLTNLSSTPGGVLVLQVQDVVL